MTVRELIARLQFANTPDAEVVVHDLETGVITDLGLDISPTGQFVINPTDDAADFPTEFEEKFAAQNG